VAVGKTADLKVRSDLMVLLPGRARRRDRGQRLNRARVLLVDDL
jgi:hypothetical protein